MGIRSGAPVLDIDAQLVANTSLIYYLEKHILCQVIMSYYSAGQIVLDNSNLV